MNRISGVMGLYWRDRRSWFYIPLLILLSTFTINLVISYYLEDEMYTGAMASTYIYLLIFGSISVNQMFPFLLGMSVRRKDFFAGIMIYALFASGVYAIFFYLLSLIESDLTNGWGSSMNFFHLPYWSDGNMMEQVLTTLLVMFHMYLIGFVCSSFYQRFGFRGLTILFVVLLAISTIGVFVLTNNQWWESIGEWVNGHTSLGLAMWTIPLSAIYCIVSYLLLMRTTA